MLNWKDYFTDEIRAWLLEESNPSVRYFTLTNLLDKSIKSPVVQSAKSSIMDRGPVKKILSHQNPDGGFLTKAIEKGCTQIEPKSGYQPKYKGTIWQALFLAQLGADESDERVKNLCEYIMCTNYIPKLKVIGLH